ncbi:hypothetical protein K1719_030125 [Acacia pycnantha]|nr:hypothetical protein K1719_030125 [Acacia pycnantha]
MPSVGRSGGLYAAWKTDQISVEIIKQGRQLFHFRYRFPGGSNFFVTTVYAIPDYRHKQLLWSELCVFRSSFSLGFYLAKEEEARPFNRRI